MQPEITGAIIGAIATIVAAIIGGWSAIRIKHLELKAKGLLKESQSNNNSNPKFLWGIGGALILGGIVFIVFNSFGYFQSIFQPSQASATAITPTPMTISSEQKILVDNSRECGEVLTMEQARRNDPEHPEYAYAGDLIIKIQKSYPKIDSLNEKPISAEKLKGYRILILLSNCDGYSSQEITTIENFVRSGGRILILGSIDNFLLSLFDIRYVGTPIEFEGEANNQDTPIPVNSSDPILSDIPDLPIHAGTALEVQDSSSVILWTPKNTYLDANTNGNKESGEKSGAFPMVVKMEYGKGYVVATANRPIWAFGFSNNYLLVLNAIQWLLAQ